MLFKYSAAPAQSRTGAFLMPVAIIIFALIVNGTTACAVTYRENRINFAASAGGYMIVSAKYVITGYRITDGQDPSGNITVGTTRIWSGNYGSINYSVGRSGSTDVANWFKGIIRSSQNTFNQNPDKLNFAFIGTLTITLTDGPLGDNQITYTLSNIALGQGGLGGTTDWWFGGKTCRYQGNNVVRCSGTTTAGKTVSFDFFHGDNTPDDIDLRVVASAEGKRPLREVDIPSSGRQAVVGKALR